MTPRKGDGRPFFNSFRFIDASLATEASTVLRDVVDGRRRRPLLADEAGIPQGGGALALAQVPGNFTACLNSNSPRDVSQIEQYLCHAEIKIHPMQRHDVCVQHKGGRSRAQRH